LRERVVDFSAELSDWAETAAVEANLDLIISIDSGVAHLAGAMGRPAWTLLSPAADWRYVGQTPDRTPWYPTMKLIRQCAPGDWADVARRVADDLAAASQP
jgi:ADP-heptose:LPS heptosyltransferase